MTCKEDCDIALSSFARPPHRRPMRKRCAKCPFDVYKPCSDANDGESLSSRLIDVFIRFFVCSIVPPSLPQPLHPSIHLYYQFASRGLSPLPHVPTTATAPHTLGPLWCELRAHLTAQGFPATSGPLTIPVLPRVALMMSRPDKAKPSAISARLINLATNPGSNALTQDKPELARKSSSCARPKRCHSPETGLCFSVSDRFHFRHGASTVCSLLVCSKLKLQPRPWVDLKSRSSLGFYNLHHRGIRAQNWGIYVIVNIILYHIRLYHIILPRIGGSTFWILPDPQKRYLCFQLRQNPQQR